MSYLCLIYRLESPFQLLNLNCFEGLSGWYKGLDRWYNQILNLHTNRFRLLTNCQIRLLEVQMCCSELNFRDQTLIAPLSPADKNRPTLKAKRPDNSWRLHSKNGAGVLLNN